VICRFLISFFLFVFQANPDQAASMMTSAFGGNPQLTQQVPTGIDSSVVA
jgi:hypothetical protein